MTQGRSQDEIRATVEALIEVAEATGGRSISSKTRAVLIRALMKEFSVAPDQVMVSEENIAKIKAHMRVLADGVIAIVDREPGSEGAPERTISTEQPEAEAVQGKRALANALDAQRRRAEDAWFAATTEMQNHAWVAGRDRDRRVRSEHHEPERRCR